MNLLKEFKQYINTANLFHQKDTLLLAVSGGVDSVVLCELCKQAGYNFVIAHCNFKLRGAESDRDEQFVKALAEKYEVPFFVKTFDTTAIAKATKKSIEETARDLRYEWFNELISNKQLTIGNTEKPGSNEINGSNSLFPIPDYVLTAHHADDNIETVLMHFFRGTGIKGLRGMLPKHNKIIRLLLFARRNELEVFAKENNLAFVTDSTNAENDYTRNYFRNELIPALTKVFPEAKENIIKNIERFKDVDDIYQEAIMLQKKKLLEYKKNEVHIPVLKLAKIRSQTTIVYEIIKDFGFTAHQTAEVIALLQSDSGKYVSSATHRIIKNRNWLIIAPNNAEVASHILIEEEGDLQFAIGNLQIKKLQRTENSKPKTENTTAQLDASSITFPLLLRKWKQGDYFYPLGMQKKKKLSRFFIDQKLSLTDKENTWVMESNKKIIWVVGMRIDDRFKIIPATKEIIELTLKTKGA